MGGHAPALPLAEDSGSSDEELGRVGSRVEGWTGRSGGDNAGNSEWQIDCRELVQGSNCSSRAFEASAAVMH